MQRDTPALAEQAPLSLADKLRVKRTQIVKDATEQKEQINRVARAAVSKIDRQIQLLEDTGSEAIIRKAAEVLAE
jgi:hypothetical protein